MGGSGANGYTPSNQCFNEKSLRFTSFSAALKLSIVKKESLILEIEKEEF